MIGVFLEVDDKMMATLGFLLLVGLLAGKAAGRLHFPAVTGYIVAGILLGPSVLNAIPEFVLHQPIEEFALCLIALAIGGELTIENLRDLGPQILGITISQLMGAFILVLIVSLLLGASLPLSLLLAALATATAPAATLAVIRQYQAKGSFTNALLAVVALDDAGCLLLFSVASAFASALLYGSGLSMGIIWAPLIEITGSLLLGGLGGLLLSYGLRHLRNDGEILTLGLSIALLVSGLAARWNLSTLLAAMTLGMVTANARRENHHLFQLIAEVEAPVYVAFFTLSGMYLQLEVLPKVGLLGIGYILARAVGKIGGAYYGALRTKAPETFRRYLGLALIPQAGVAIGLGVVSSLKFPELQSTIMTIVLASVVTSEIVGPLGAKYALMRAGDIPTRPSKTSSKIHKTPLQQD
jgi:Kef-type K+ transport system membrane component KefB